MNGVWLNGERFDVAYFLDLESDRVRRFVTKGSRIGPTAGRCRRVLGGHAALFVSPIDHTLRLWTGGATYPVDGTVTMRHRLLCGGFGSTLLLTTREGVHVRVDTLTPARPFMRRFDPAYDALDESMDDFLADVADVASSAERRAWILSKKDPTAGPWHLLGQAE